MTTENPYQAPESDVSQAQNNKPYQPKFLSAHGRIGRLRYLAYLSGLYLLAIPVAGVFFAIITSVSDGEGGIMMGLFSLMALAAYIALLVFVFILAKRRFNDMNKSGWLSLLMFIPLVNLFIALWLIFGRGTVGPNNFGAEPNKNPLGVKILAGVMILLFVGGILAAVSIPAYQDYLERQASYENYSE